MRYSWRVRHRPSVISACALVLALTWPTASHADFDPRGRQKPKPGPTQPKPTGTKPKPTGKPTPPSATSTTTPSTPSPPSADGSIARYMAIVIAQPGALFPLQRLAQLYREKDGNLKALTAELEKRAGEDGAGRYGAIVGLAGIYKIDGRPDDAIAAFEKAIAIKANDPAALLSLARLQQDRGNVAAAKARYEQALALQTALVDKEQTLRTLMTLALDAKDWDGAASVHDRLVKLEPTSLFVRGELGRELFTRGEYERAEKELTLLVQAAAGDNRALAPALKELGRAQAKAQKRDAALATLKRALQAAGSEAAARAEIYETITEVYRAEQRLGELVKQLEAEHPTDFARLSILGGLYEETGDAALAIATYKKALAQKPRHIDLRLKLVRLLQSQGDLDRAIAEYEGLIRAAPNNPQFVFEQCDALLQRGDRARALRLLTELEARAGTDEDVLGRLADFYGRIGEGEKSLRILTRLASVATGDAGHLVDLGAHYFQDGNRDLALQTWRRILVTVQPRARALAAYGDVLLEHDLINDALTALREAAALDRDNVQIKRQLAGALEKAKGYAEAERLWLEIGERAKKSNDRILARDVRAHLVTVWSLERRLENQVAALGTRFNALAPDLEAGRLLAEVQLHLRRTADAEATLRRLVTLAPGDVDGLRALENVLSQTAKFDAAIEIACEKLVAADPKTAREAYGRCATYAQKAFRDDDAVKYRQRAVELNPEDAEGHRGLAETYRARQDTERAIAEYRAALARNERLFTVYFDLADLLMTRGQAEEADRLYRRVIRGAPDEELVARAARLAIQINLGRGTLESLEQDLLPLAIGNPQKAIYRRLLMEVYGSLTFGLVEASRHESRGAKEARDALARIGARAVKPLLDALASGDAGQQRIAIDVLSHVENKNAAPALFAFATGTGDLDLRARAMTACGMLKSPAMRERYEALLLPKGRSDEGTPTDPVAVGAVFSLAKLEDKRSLPALRALMKRGTPPMRVYAALGIAALKDRSATSDLLALARSVDGGNVARAGAAYALGELSPDAETESALVAVAQSESSLARALALVALGRIGAQKSSVGAMTSALFEPTIEGRGALGSIVPRAATAGLVLLANPGLAKRFPSPLSSVETTLEVEELMGALVPRDFTEAERARAVLTYGDAISDAAVAALRTSGERAHAVLDAVGRGDGALRPFFGAESGPALEPARERARAIAKALTPAAVGLVRHPDAALRTKALTLLASGTTDEATGAVLRAVEDQNESVQRMALAAVGAQASRAAVQACARVLETSESWAIRVLAADALGRLGAKGSREAAEPLARAATRDSYALVREAALRAVTFDPNVLARVIREVEASDPEPRVREAAESLARGGVKSSKTSPP